MEQKTIERNILDISFKCLECGKKFKTTAAAEKAFRNGCPKCNGGDIDVDEEAK